MRWNWLNGVPRGSKNGSGAIIRMRTVRVIFARNHSTVTRPFRTNARGFFRTITGASAHPPRGEALRQRHSARDPLLPDRHRTAVGHGAPGLGAVAPGGAADLRRQHSRLDLALEAAARRAARAAAQAAAARVVSRRELLQQFP